MILRLLRLALAALLIAAGVYCIVQIFRSTSNPFLLVEQFEIWRDQARVATRAWKVLTSAAVIWIGVLLCSSPKHTVLFLRRFGDGVNLIVSRALRGGAVRRFRVVTLDDGLFPTAAVLALERWTVRLLPIALLVIVFLVSGSLLDTLTRSADAGASLNEEISMMRGFWFGLLTAIAAFLFIHLLHIGANARARITWPAHLDFFVRLMARLRSLRAASPLMAPQSTVVTCAPPLWRAVVHEGIREASVVLVNLSEPTENICWEIEQLDALSRPRLYIAEASHLNAWLEDQNPATLALHQRVRALIGHSEVLKYSSAQRNPHRQLRINLARALSGILASAPPSPRPARRQVRIPALGAAALSSLAYATVALSLSAVAGYVIWRLTRGPLLELWPLRLETLIGELVEQWNNQVSSSTAILATVMIAMNTVLWLLSRAVLRRHSAPPLQPVFWRYIVPAACMCLSSIPAAVFAASIDFEWSAVAVLIVPLLTAAAAIRAWLRVMNASPPPATLKI